MIFPTFLNKITILSTALFYILLKLSYFPFSTVTMVLMAGDTVIISKGKYAGHSAIFVKLSGALSADVKLIRTNQIVTIRRRSFGAKVVLSSSDGGTPDNVSKMAHSPYHLSQVSECTRLNGMDQVIQDLESITQQLSVVQFHLKQLVLSENTKK